MRVTQLIEKVLKLLRLKFVEAFCRKAAKAYKESLGAFDLENECYQLLPH